MGNLWPFFQIICLLGIGSANSSEGDFNEEIYKLANEIFENYFQIFKCVTYAADDVRNSDYLEKILPMLVIDLSVGGGESSRRVLRESYEQGCGGVIVQTKGDNRVGMARALRDAKREAVSFRYNRERYLFLPVSGNDTNLDLLLDDSMFFLPNILSVIPDGSSRTGRFLLNGHAVFDPERKDPVEVLDAWTLSKGFERRADLYPDRIKNVKGKNLVLGLIHYVPYSVILQENNRTIYDGVETRIAAQFVETINGTYTGLDHPVEMWGNKFPNGSGNGIFGSVQRHEADLGYSAIYQWYCDVLDCSYPYLQAEVICLVPKPRIITSWKTFLLPFATSTWIGLWLAYFISSCFMLSVGLAARRLNGSGTSENFVLIALHSGFDVFRLQMQQVPRVARGNRPLAVFVRVSLFFYFSVSTFWQSGIASILTVPRYEEPIDTTAQLVSRWPQVKWGANSDVWIYSIENTTERDLHEIVKKFQILDSDTLVRKTRTRDFAFFMEKLPNKHYGFSEYINEETVPFLRLMQYNIYTGFAVIILPRASPYTEKLDHMIHWLFATGMTQKIEVQVSLERINNHLQNMIRYSNEKESGRVILTVSHIKGPLYLYFGGMFISMATLLGEKFLIPKKLKKTHRK